MTRVTKRTLRKMSHVARQVAELGNDADTISRRAHRLAHIIVTLEADSVALENFMAATGRVKGRKRTPKASLVGDRNTKLGGEGE